MRRAGWCRRVHVSAAARFALFWLDAQIWRPIADHLCEVLHQDPMNACTLLVRSLLIVRLINGLSSGITKNGYAITKQKYGVDLQ
jgi:hypothetical protein